MISINDQLIEVKAGQCRAPNNKSLLIKEIFLLWYALLEGIECESFEERELSVMLDISTKKFKSNYYNDEDCTFIVGWAVNASFWVFNGVFKEEDGKNFLLFAYKKKPANALFKWAVWHELNLSNKDVKKLTKALQSNFEDYYNYGPSIKDYFLGVITASGSIQ